MDFVKSHSNNEQASSQTAPPALPKVAIVGKPNVGKSSLFNILCRRKFAIVSKKAGTTRDRREHAVEFLGLHFAIIDTAGWESGKQQEALLGEMIRQTEIAINEANILLLVLDGLSGLSSEDMDFVRLVRRAGKPCIVLLNKTEGKMSSDAIDAAYSLGLGTPILFSATHRLGLDELYNQLKELIPPESKLQQQAQHTIAIIGRPNAGKSTIFNKIIGQERAIVADVAGTTRDSTTYSAHGYAFIDTAGLRKKSRITEELDSLSAGQSLTAIRRSDTVLLVMDATAPIAKQDLTLAHVAINEGKGLILVVNKCDKVEDLTKLREYISHEAAILHAINKLPILFISAITGRYVSKLIKAIERVQASRERQLTTNELNRWLENATRKHFPPSLRHAKATRLKYITQTATKPPTFEIFTNVTISSLPKHYARYLQKSLSDNFDLAGTPIRIKLRKTANPYVRNQ